MQNEIYVRIFPLNIICQCFPTGYMNGSVCECVRRHRRSAFALTLTFVDCATGFSNVFMRQKYQHLKWFQYPVSFSVFSTRLFLYFSLLLRESFLFFLTLFKCNIEININNMVKNLMSRSLVMACDIWKICMNNKLFSVVLVRWFVCMSAGLT